MNLQELPELLRKKFIPFAFTCDCGGKDKSCKSALDDPKLWAQKDTVERICKTIEELAKADGATIGAN